MPTLFFPRSISSEPPSAETTRRSGPTDSEKNKMQNSIGTSRMSEPTDSRIKQLLPGLCRRAAFCDGAASVELIQTHISWVFLTDTHAYKLKKPVHFDFVDFRTLEKRRTACQDEVRLNRRLAESVYLDVVPIIVDESGRPIVQPHRSDKHSSGDVVEWAVKMRRLPAAASLDQRLLSGRLDSSSTRRIAEHLSAFFRSASATSMSSAAYLARYEDHVRDNARVLSESAGEAHELRVARVSGAQLQFLALKPHLFTQRVDEKRVLDGHGDLRPEHIYLVDEPVVIDCIEFSEELRQIDVADELAFLEMECDVLHASQVGGEISRHCLNALGDAPPLALREFYKCYRACVRAKVAALKAAADDDDPATAGAFQRYLELADDYARRFNSPLLIVVRGLMGTGKSTLAEALATQLGAVHLSTDAIRREQLGESQSPAAYGEGIYTASQRRRVYEMLCQRAAALLAGGRSAILDGAFLKADQWRSAAAMAEKQQAPAFCVVCQCPQEVSRQRIANRGFESRSEARPELLTDQRREEERFGDDACLHQVDTTQSPEATLNQALQFLRRQ